jgi:hypothetical protein
MNSKQTLRMAALHLTLLCVPRTGSGQGLIDGFFRGQGNTDLAFSIGWEWYDQFWVGDTKVDAPVELGAISTNTYDIYIAHGLRDDLELIGSAPSVSRSGDGAAPPPDEDAFQDGAIYIKYRAWQSASTSHGFFSIQPAFGLVTPISNYQGDTPVAIGHQSTDIDSRILVQYSANSGWFAALQTGFTARIGDAPHAVPLGLKVGYGGSKVYVAGWFALQNSTSGTDIMQGPFPTNEIDYSRIGADLYFHVRPQFGISLGVGITLDGRNVGDSSQVAIGVVFRRRPDRDQERPAQTQRGGAPTQTQPWPETASAAVVTPCDGGAGVSPAGPCLANAPCVTSVKTSGRGVAR